MEIKHDYTEEVRRSIPESIQIAQQSGLSDALDFLLGVEKKCRLGNDTSNLKEVVLHMLRLCREQNDWEKLINTLNVIAKRRAQSKYAITALVQESMGYIDDSPNDQIKEQLIVTLKDICEGKIYVEGEGAKFTMMLSKMKEAQGDIAAACDAIQDVHVETYGSLSKLEKAEYILEQIRLNLLRKDYVRALIQSRKMNRKIIEDEGFEEVKIKYYELMIEYHTHERDAWELCQAYHRIYDTRTLKTNDEPRLEALRCTVIFLLLAPYTNHQSDMIHRLKQYKDLDLIPEYKNAVRLFTTPEIIPYPFPDQQVLENHSSLGRGDTSLVEHWRETFHARIVQHNLRVVSKYYTRIQTKRLATLLGLTENDTERHLSDMVANDDIFVKIDRPRGICCFQAPKAPEEVLSEWNSDISKLLSLMEATCHLVGRENMVHKI